MTHPMIIALDHQFDSRIFDWEKKATGLSEKEENFLEVVLLQVVLL